MIDGWMTRIPSPGVVRKTPEATEIGELASEHSFVKGVLSAFVFLSFRFQRKLWDMVSFSRNDAEVNGISHTER
jgi:hypothetical protein